MNRTIRYRLHPKTQAKAHQLQATAGACRYVWNHFVSKLQDEYACYGKANYRFYTLGKQFTLFRKHSVPWLQDYSMNIVRGTLQPIEVNYKNFFNGNGGLPKFKGKYTSIPSFPLVSGTFKMSGNSHIHIQKIGTMRINGTHPYLNSKPVSGTVKYECGKWYVYLSYKIAIEDMPNAKPHTLKEVGVDRNVGQITLSDGQVYHTPSLDRLEARKRRYSRIMARRVKGSKRRHVARYRLAKTHQKIAQIRTNWCHQVSRKIADKYDVVYLENLNIKGMSTSAKGTIEDPGKNVKQKSGLNREIQNTCWGKLYQHLSYKSTVIKVPASYTSQRCGKCGHRDKMNRKTQANFTCLSCGHWDNADVNAALNILAFGNGASGRGDSEVTRSVKRQMDTLFSVE